MSVTGTRAAAIPAQPPVVPITRQPFARFRVRLSASECARPHAHIRELRACFGHGIDTLACHGMSESSPNNRSRNAKHRLRDYAEAVYA